MLENFFLNCKILIFDSERESQADFKSFIKTQTFNEFVESEDLDRLSAMMAPLTKFDRMVLKSNDDKNTVFFIELTRPFYINRKNHGKEYICNYDFNIKKLYVINNTNNEYTNSDEIFSKKLKENLKCVSFASTFEEKVFNLKRTIHNNFENIDDVGVFTDTKRIKINSWITIESNDIEHDIQFSFDKNFKKFFPLTKNTIEDLLKEYVEKLYDFDGFKEKLENTWETFKYLTTLDKFNDDEINIKINDYPQPLKRLLSRIPNDIDKLKNVDIQNDPHAEKVFNCLEKINEILNSKNTNIDEAMKLRYKKISIKGIDFYFIDQTINIGGCIQLNYNNIQSVYEEHSQLNRFLKYVFYIGEQETLNNKLEAFILQNA